MFHNHTRNEGRKGKPEIRRVQRSKRREEGNKGTERMEGGEKEKKRKGLE